MDKNFEAIIQTAVKKPKLMNTFTVLFKVKQVADLNEIQLSRSLNQVTLDGHSNIVSCYLILLVLTTASSVLVFG